MEDSESAVLAPEAKTADGLNVVFVYGTLLSGQGNAGLWQKVGGRFGSGEPHPVNRSVSAAMLPGAALYGKGYGFPYLALNEPEAPRVVVQGELVAVDDATLAQMDRLEGVPHHYRRVQVTAIVSGEGDGTAETWVYTVANPEMLTRRGMERIESGSWLTELSRQEAELAAVNEARDKAPVEQLVFTVTVKARAMPGPRSAAKVIEDEILSNLQDLGTDDVELLDIAVQHVQRD
jgi:gamma-glutamylcyclotransferase (GGCT)/AIG2-like uncharacterized protein YtfP